MVKALIILHRCAGWPEPLPFTNVLSTFCVLQLLQGQYVMIILQKLLMFNKNKECVGPSLDSSFDFFEYYLGQPCGKVNSQGQIVQSIVSLTRSLRGQLVKCFTNLYPKYTDIFC